MNKLYQVIGSDIELEGHYLAIKGWMLKQYPTDWELGLALADMKEMAVGDMTEFDDKTIMRVG